MSGKVIRIHRDDKQTRKMVRQARSIKAEGYLNSISSTTNVSREFYRRGVVRL